MIYNLLKFTYIRPNMSINLIRTLGKYFLNSFPIGPINKSQISAKPQLIKRNLNFGICLDYIRRSIPSNRFSHIEIVGEF